MTLPWLPETPTALGADVVAASIPMMRTEYLAVETFAVVWQVVTLLHPTATPPDAWIPMVSGPGAREAPEPGAEPSPPGPVGSKLIELTTEERREDPAEDVAWLEGPEEVEGVEEPITTPDPVTENVSVVGVEEVVAVLVSLTEKDGVAPLPADPPAGGT